MSISYNFDHLPDTVLSLSGYEFNQFIKSTLGEPEADLLNKISVQTTSSFLITEDPLDIFNYDIEDEELDKLKEKLSFKLKNKKILIKPGVISGFRSLRDALRKKADQQLAKSKKRQRRQQQSSNVNPSSVPLSVITASTTGLPTTRSATITKKLSPPEHRAHVLKLINKWCSENKENFGLETLSLEENVDFMLNIELDENSDVKGSIKCRCNRLISLGKNDNKIQLSNYYKHLQSKGCDHMKYIKMAAKDLTSVQLNPSTPLPLTSLSQSRISLAQLPAVSPTTTLTTSVINSPLLSNEPARGSKRSLASQSQQHHSAKRSRT